MRLFSKKTFMLLVGIVAALALAGVAAASVTFDPTCPYTPSNGTGTCGFVGKGDVQLALGYNNSQMQKNAGSLLFTYAQAARRRARRTARRLARRTGRRACRRLCPAL